MRDQNDTRRLNLKIFNMKLSSQQAYICLYRNCVLQGLCHLTYFRVKQRVNHFWYFLRRKASQISSSNYTSDTDISLILKYLVQSGFKRLTAPLAIYHLCIKLDDQNHDYMILVSSILILLSLIMVCALHLSILGLHALYAVW